MTNEELLAQDTLLWTHEGRRRILILMDKARAEGVKIMESECSTLAAGVCEFRGGNEHGNPICLKTNTII